MANTYDVGDVARLSAAFTQTAVAIDPSTVTVTYVTPSGNTTVYVYAVNAELVKASTGNYYVDVALTAAGIYRWRWVSTGTGAAASEGWLQVRQQDVP